MPLGPAFAAVLRGAREGDEEALGALYRDLSPSVLGYLRGQRAPEPEDLAQEVFVSVIRGLASFEGDESGFRSWVFTIAHRRLLDEWRRRARRPVEPVEPERLPEVPGGDAEEEAVGLVGGLEALDELTPEQRAVILLRVVADLPLARVAEVLERRESAIRALQRRATRRLIKIFSAQVVR